MQQVPDLQEEISQAASQNQRHSYFRFVFAVIILFIFVISLSLIFKQYFSKKEEVKERKTVEPFSIREIKETEFAKYHPYVVNITPAAPIYQLPVNLNSVKNNKMFTLDAQLKDKLSKQGFVAALSNYDQIYTLYKDNSDKGRPNFVTVDALLHSFHILYDYTLRNLEINKFIPDLKNLNKAMLDQTRDQYENINNAVLKEAIKKNIAYFAVASKLLDQDAVIPPLVKDVVDQELASIDKHEGFEISPIFGFEEDYSQYVPRGHYTRNDDFKSYFKCMMWYGRMGFRIQPPKNATTAQVDIEKARDETRRAIMIVLTVNQSKVGDKDALQIWERIYQPTVFFVGKSDDLSIYDYQKVIQEVFGQSVEYAVLSEDAKIDQFIEAVKVLPSPKISSSLVSEVQDAPNVTKGFRFMGQRFIPDSYVLGQLVFSHVQDYQGKQPLPFTAATIETLKGKRTVRVFPRGLDVAAVLGSQKAKEILDTEGDSAYQNYDEQYTKLKNEFASLPQDQWVENLYWNWLYVLLPTLNIKGEGYPIFVQQASWLDKDLNSFLGSWTELRHDTILYAKQSYTDVGITSVGPEKPKFEDAGYIEPNPEVFARLASLALYMREGLDSRNLLEGEYKDKLTQMENLNLELEKIAEKELTNQTLNEDDYNLIKNIGSTLEDLVTFSSQETEKITSEADTKMEIVADVHTDGNNKQVLEEGVGKPLELLVVVKDGNDLVLTSGGIFSYYEFKQPMSQRLTDEDWQKMEKLALPRFTESFVEK